MQNYNTMKKTWMIAAAMVAMLSLASCQKEQPACWEVTITEHMKGMGMDEDLSTTTVIYGTESEIDAQVKQLTSTSMSMPGMQVTFDVDKKKLDKSEADCF